MKNKPSFFNWQGNHLGWQDYFTWLFLGIAFVMLLALFLTKDLIRARFDRQGKILWFNSHTSFWRTAGIIGLIFSLARTIIFVINRYPYYWENLNIHICRVHIAAIFLLMTIGKYKWIKYITYVSVFASLFGLYFGSEVSEIVNNHHGKTWEQAVSASPGYTPKIFDKLLFEDGFTFYNVGFDNLWFYDFLLSHLSIIFFPIFIRIAYGLKFSTKEFYFMQLVYMIVFLFIWVGNALTDEFIPSQKWKMNNWFVGMRNANDFIGSLGILSGWPQNLFTYSLIGVVLIHTFHFLLIYLDKFHFFTNGKIVQVKKSSHLIEIKNKNASIKAS